MSENARVWTVYRDEAAIRDEAMLDGWNKTLDILLIFAGLFSAVATAFIVESYKLLQPDYTEYAARALYVLASSANASTGLDLPVLRDPSGLGSTKIERPMRRALLATGRVAGDRMPNFDPSARSTAGNDWGARSHLLWALSPVKDPSHRDIWAILGRPIRVIVSTVLIAPRVLPITFQVIARTVRTLPTRLYYEAEMRNPRAVELVVTEEHAIIQRSSARLDASAVRWIILQCSAPEVLAVACQAPAALHPSSPTAIAMRENLELIHTIGKLAMRSFGHGGGSVTDRPDLLKYARATLGLRGGWHWYRSVRVGAWVHTVDAYDSAILSTVNEFHHRDPLRTRRLRKLLTNPTGALQALQDNASFRHPFLTSTVLQVLHSPSVYFWNQLRLVAGLDATALDVYDVDDIARTLNNSIERPEHEEHKLCNSCCVADLVCEIMLLSDPTQLDPDPELRDPGLDADELKYLFVQITRFPWRWEGRKSSYPVNNIWRVAASANSLDAWPAVAVATFATFFAQSVTASGVVSHSVNGTELTSACLNLIRVGRTLKESESYLWPRVVESVARALNEVYFASGSAYTDSMNSNRVSHSIRARIDSAACSASTPTIAITGPLFLLHSQPGFSSPWQLIVESLPELSRSGDEHAVLNLADTLASHLCSYTRLGLPGAERMIVELSVHEWGVPLLKSLMSMPLRNEYGKVGVYLDAVAHCIELDRNWWPSLLAQVELLEDGYRNDEVKIFARELDAKIRRGKLRACKTCLPRRTTPLAVGGSAEDEV
ncbi:hypothetical protein EXIGLDRAFT_757013 [Exidia glandulosa HHB12029]|uniref:DUF6535 domain-containing protein n=1 Tax=Exidia glandulosa HHB12029 TaxID=1314781 RepID=A0A165ATB8_EXIGL|nr:hypothetical protein EXIGLDRAFT_757013 [Exidia glandulosa HHB12029]